MNERKIYGVINSPKWPKKPKNKHPRQFLIMIHVEFTFSVQYLRLSYIHISWSWQYMQEYFIFLAMYELKPCIESSSYMMNTKPLYPKFSASDILTCFHIASD